MSWLSKFIGGVGDALKDPVVVVTAALYIATGNYAAAAVTIASAGAANALAPTPDLPSYNDFASDAVNRTQQIKQPTAPRRFVYGETRVSGLLAHVESTNSDKKLHLVIAIAAHEIDSFQQIYLNDEVLTLDGSGNVTAPSRYAGKVRIKTHLGSDTQAADSDLVAESESGWSNSHRLQGVAYIYARLDFDVDAFPNGIPNISAKVRGKKVYDPRTATTAFSSNPALCMRDYLMNDRYGLGADSDEINDTDFTAAANACDESVALAAGGTENRYEFHGTLVTSNAPKRILEEMITSCGGIISYVNGKFSLKVAEYVAPTVTLDENDLIDKISLQTRRSKRDNYNAIKGVFSPTDTNFVPTDYPALTSSTFEAEDGGSRKFIDFDLPYTTSHTMAQRLAKIALFRNRQQLSMQLSCSLKAFDLSVGDNVSVTNSRLGFSSKVFQIVEWTFAVRSDNDNNPVLAVDLFLRENNSAVYDWNADEKAFVLDNTTLPDPFAQISAPGLAISDALQTFNQKAVSVLIVDVSSGSTYADRFEVEVKKSTDSTFISLGTSSSTRFEFADVEDGVVYDIRARIISSIGVKSSYATAQHQIVGKSASASDVSDFTINVVGNQAQLSWTPVTDLDLSHYRIRHSPLTTGATYANATDLIAKVSRPANTAVAPAITGTYLIKAVDKLGNESVNATETVAIVDEIGVFNAVQTINEHPSFSGTKTGTAVVGSELLLDTSVIFDSATGNFDDANGLFDGGGGFVNTSGTYDFSTVVDMGAVFTERVTASVTVTRRDYVALFDDAAGNFDDRSGNFDGDPQAFGDTNVELQISTTEDDPNGASPTYTAFRKFVVGTYKARGMKFRAVLTTTDTEATPVVSALSVTVDMPDRVLSDNDVVSGTGAKVITFSSALKQLQGLGISAQNLTSGDYYAITNKSATGFTITFYNSSDAAVSRTFDYVAKGF